MVYGLAVRVSGFKMQGVGICKLQTSPLRVSGFRAWRFKIYSGLGAKHSGSASLD